MPNREALRISLHALRLEVRERLIDLLCPVWPVFAVTGVAALAATFWARLLGWS